MGYKEFDIKVPLTSGNDDLQNIIRRISHVKKFSFQILKKSLDARNKSKIVWLFRVGIISDEINEGFQPNENSLHTENKKRDKHVVIVGSGPAGIFSAIYLASCGFEVIIIEQGSSVEERKKAINDFENDKKFDPVNNYSFGEGGAGTFSDGKLTSRTKSISRERNFIYNQLVKSGAPGEIQYMTHPHLGSDNLFKITQKLRTKLLDLGCTYLFDTKLIDINHNGSRLTSINTTKGTIESDYFIFATGLASYETYRMLIKKGVPYHLKNFALGIQG